ncbi:MAG TPA: glycosyltransferase family 39 protein, partial [Solirubrobacteraceae bacterium]|nr:glycosyltransferase family 39 protein [Solirubrobacteraceae bacterium]
ANDAHYYLTLASQVAHDGDYANTGVAAGGAHGATAYFPPAFPYLLAAVDAIDGHRIPGGAAVEPARLTQAVLGTVSVGLVGLVALEIFGVTVALLALAIAAIYPPLVALSGSVYSENLLIPLILAAIWAALRARRSGTPYRWVAVSGVLIGLATLTHQNGIVVVFALLPAVWSIRRAPLLLIGLTVLTIAPWTIRNAVVMHSFIPVSDETGFTIAGTYNPTSAHDPRIPYRWRYLQVIPADAALAREAHRFTEPRLGSKLQHVAFSYIGHHPLAPLAAAYHNTRRLLDLEGSFAWRASTYNIGVPRSTARAGVLGSWVLALLAVCGAFTAAARRAPRWLWITPLFLYLSVVFVNAETPRFRAPIDPFLIMLAACALAGALAHVRAKAARRSDRGAPVGRDELRAPTAGSVSQLVEMGQGRA